MAKANDEARGQGKDDKSIIDHLAKEVFTPKTASEGEPKEQSSTTSDGTPVEEQVRKEWDPKKSGGLPIFTGRRV